MFAHWRTPNHRPETMISMRIIDRNKEVAGSSLVNGSIFFKYLIMVPASSINAERVLFTDETVGSNPTRDPKYFYSARFANATRVCFIKKEHYNISIDFLAIKYYNDDMNSDNLLLFLKS